MGTFTGFCSRNMGFAPGRCVEETEHAHPVSYTHLDVYKRQGWDTFFDLFATEHESAEI